MTLAGAKIKSWDRQAKDAERRRKAAQNENPHREDHEGSAGRVKNFQAPAMLKTTPLDCE
jgi:hypothetical protein